MSTKPRNVAVSFSFTASQPASSQQKTKSLQKKKEEGEIEEESLKH
jgi:hypothetical protein